MLFTLRYLRFCMPLPLLLLLLALAGSLTTAPVQAAQSYDNCTGFIDALPAVISTQGTWCLRQDLSTNLTTGSAITIAANNVTVDCNDFLLVSGGGSYGLFAENRLNTTIRNCTVQGFIIGIRLVGTSGGNVVEDNRLDKNLAVGIQIVGNGSVVRHNRITNTGGQNISVAYGIQATGSVDVLDNIISGVAPLFANALLSYGIVSESNGDDRQMNSQIANNRVTGLVGISPSVKTVAIYVENPVDANNRNRITLRDNDVVGDGSAGSVGLRCSQFNGDRFNVAIGNVVKGFANGITDCAATSGNVIVP